MTTSNAVSDPTPFQLGQWPRLMSLRTYSGQSIAIMTVRTGLLVALFIKVLSFGDTAILALAVCMLVADLTQTGMQVWIYIRGQVLRKWVERLAGGDLEYRGDTMGNDEIAIYARVVDALRRYMLEAQSLQNEQIRLAQNLRRNNEVLEATVERLRKTQDQLVSQQKLAELGELSAGVAHEIRNPLQFVKNFAESSDLLARELTELVERPDGPGGGNAPEQIAEVVGDLRDNMERIVQHSNRVDRIVSDILTIGHDSGQLEFRPVDVNQLLVEQATLAYNAVRARTDDDFVVNIQKDLDFGVGNINAVIRDLSRVFVNIVTNACHAIIAKGARADEGFQPTIWLKTARTGEGVEVSIRDNGTGMAPEVMDKIFNVFFTTKDANSGTGLGMSISRDIVLKHGGTITPESVVGEYTEMKIRFPSDSASTPRDTA